MGTIMIGVLMVLMLVTGCSSTPDPMTASAPEWAVHGSGVLVEKDPQSIYGVGAVIGVKNGPLAWDVAESRARAEIARTIQSRTTMLLRDYAASVSQMEGHTADEQSLDRGVKTFTAMTLTGARVYDRHYDPITQTYSVTVKLNLKDFQQTLKEMQELNPKVRAYIQQNAEKMFERMDQEEARLKKSE